MANYFHLHFTARELSSTSTCIVIMCCKTCWWQRNFLRLADRLGWWFAKTSKSKWERMHASRPWRSVPKWLFMAFGKFSFFTTEPDCLPGWRLSHYRLRHLSVSVLSLSFVLFIHHRWSWPCGSSGSTRELLPWGRQRKRIRRLTQRQTNSRRWKNTDSPAHGHVCRIHQYCIQIGN